MIELETNHREVCTIFRLVYGLNLCTCVLVRQLLRQVRAVPAQQLYLHQLPGGQRRGGGRGRGGGGGGVTVPGPGPAHLGIVDSGDIVSAEPVCDY